MIQNLITKHRFKLLVVAYFCVGLLYIWATPPFEASDEYKHYPVVQHVQTQWRLPVLNPQDPGLWLQEGAQPPLYYVIMAAVTLPIDTSDIEELHRVNRHAYIGNGDQLFNKNLIFHDPTAERWPFSGSVLAIYIVRVTTLFLGVTTLFMTGHIGKELFSAEVGFWAAALVAFNPMFLFITSAVNNDALAAMLGAIGTLLLVRLWRDTPSWEDGKRKYIILGILCGLAMLTKLSLAGILLMAGFVTAWQAWQREDWGILFKGGLCTFIIAMVIVGPWLWRNFMTYGDIVGLNAFIAVQGTRPDQSLAGVPWRDEFGTFYRTFWGLFGGVNILAPSWFYRICNAIVVTAGLGLVWRRWGERKQAPSGTIVIVGWVMILFVLLIRWTVIYESFQGRLMFPSLAGINVLVVAGLFSLARLIRNAQIEKWVMPVVAGWMFIMAAAMPPFIIAPEYPFPETSSMPEAAAFGPITFESAEGERLSLIGIEVDESQITTPGSNQGVEIIAYWRADTQLTQDYVTSIHLLGRELQSVGQVDRHPAWGAVPPTDWEVGDVYQDRYRLFATDDAAAPARLQFSVDVIDPRNIEYINHFRTTQPVDEIIAYDPSGNQIDLVRVGASILSAGPNQEFAEPAVQKPVDFADFVSLVGYDITTTSEEDTLIFSPHWQANGTPSQPYTVFAQLLDINGNYIQGADSPPLSGDYPTNIWQNGDYIIDNYKIIIPDELTSGRYQIAFGFYNPQSGVRMARLDGGDAVIVEVTLDR